MKKYVFLLIAIFGLVLSSKAQVGYGTNNPDPRSVIELNSTDKAFYLPRLTTAQLNAQIGWKAGMMVYNTDSNCVFFRRASNWDCLVFGLGHEPWFGEDDDMGATLNTENIYQMGRVGVGTDSSLHSLDVRGDFGVYSLPTIPDATRSGISESFSSPDYTTGNAIIYTTFTTGSDILTSQTIYETGAAGVGTELLLNSGVLRVYAGNTSAIYITYPVSPNTSYSVAVVYDLTGDQLRLYLVEGLGEGVTSSDLIGSASFTQNDWAGSNGTGVGLLNGLSRSGISGTFLGSDLTSISLYATNDINSISSGSTPTILANSVGNVGIGANSPSEKLDVNVQVRIRSGSPDSSKVLTSIDATGKAEWRHPVAPSFQIEPLSPSRVYRALTANFFTGTEMVLPPGKWAVDLTMVVMMTHGTDAHQPIPDGSGIWVRSTFTNSSTSSTPTPDFEGAKLFSSDLVGPMAYTLLRGRCVINNTSGADKTYYYWYVNPLQFGTPISTTFKLRYFGSDSYGENSIVVTRLTQ